MGLLSAIVRPVLKYWAGKPPSPAAGELYLPGLRDEVRVRWGPHTVPHVAARHEQDLFFAQGYLHARERLWQMDANRLFLSGRSAEVLGERKLDRAEISVRFENRTTVDLDYFMRLMGIRRAAMASLKLLPGEFYDRLRFYAAGVNAYIETHLKRLPIEFCLLRHEPEPWRAEDSLTVGKGFAFLLSTALLTRLTLGQIAQKLGGQEAKLRELCPSYPADGPSVTRVFLESSSGLLKFLSGFQGRDWPRLGQGSNSWVVGPERSQTKRPILCNDPHLRLLMPSIWYLMHLGAIEPEPWEVWGASIPGMPCIQIGHNRWIAWGITAALCDDMELYREKVHPQSPDHYSVNGTWHRMVSEQETIRVRHGTDQKKTVRFTRHGPVVSDFACLPSEDEVLALRWTAHDPSSEFLAVYGINRARNWEEFRASLSFQVAPPLNFLYADGAGNIGYSLAGRIPIRGERPSFLPLAGWDESNDWKGYVPFDELPRLYNPPQKLVATANNRIVAGDYPYYLSDLHEAPYRIRRIQELLDSKETLSLDDMARIQSDHISVHAREVLMWLREDLETTKKRNLTLNRAVEMLLEWDGSCSEESPEAALFHVFYHRLMRNLLVPDLGEELFAVYAEIFNQALVPVDQIFQSPRSVWWKAQGRAQLVEKSLTEAREELLARLGGEEQSWRWGDLHTLTLTHAMAASKILAPFFAVGPFPSPGDGVTVNMGFYDHARPYQHIVGPSLRLIADVDVWENSRWMMSAGQSGHPFSAHYQDLTSLWRRGDYIRLCFQEEEMAGWPLVRLRAQPR